jgi:hypothetical protein
MTTRTIIVIIAVLGLISDAVALYFAFHSRRHEKENAEKLEIIECMLIECMVAEHVGEKCECCGDSFELKTCQLINNRMLCPFCAGGHQGQKVDLKGMN